MEQVLLIVGLCLSVGVFAFFQLRGVTRLYDEFEKNKKSIDELMELYAERDQTQKKQIAALKDQYDELWAAKRPSTEREGG